MTKAKNDSIKKTLKVVGQNIRRERGEMSQGELAKLSGVSRSTIQKIESGISIEFDNLLLIAAALGLTPADLYLTDEERREVNYKLKIIADRLAELLQIKIDKKGES